MLLILFRFSDIAQRNRDIFVRIDDFYKSGGMENTIRSYISFGSDKCYAALNKQMTVIKNDGPSSWIKYRNNPENIEISTITKLFADINARLAEVSERLSDCRNPIIIRRFVKLHSTNLLYIYKSVPPSYLDIIKNILNDPYYGNGLQWLVDNINRS